MKSLRFLTRFFALWLALALALPSPALGRSCCRAPGISFADRAYSAVPGSVTLRGESSQETGAEEQLRWALADHRDLNPAASTVQWLTGRLSGLLGLPAASPKNSLVAAGAEEVKQAIRGLKSPDPAVRRFAAAALGEISMAYVVSRSDPAALGGAVGPLSAAVEKDSSAEVRRGAVIALGMISRAYAVSRSDPAVLGRAVGPLSAAVEKDSSADVRRDSVVTLDIISAAYVASRSDPAVLGGAVGPLSAAVEKDSDPQVKMTIARVLSEWERAGLIRLSPGTKLKVEVALRGGLDFSGGLADQQAGAEEEITPETDLTLLKVGDLLISKDRRRRYQLLEKAVLHGSLYVQRLDAVGDAFSDAAWVHPQEIIGYTRRPGGLLDKAKAAAQFAAIVLENARRTDAPQVTLADLEGRLLSAKGALRSVLSAGAEEVKQAIRDLKSSDPAVRRASAATLSEMGMTYVVSQSDPAVLGGAVGPLSAAVEKDSSVKVRRAAAAALGMISMAYAVFRSDPAALGGAVGPLSAAVEKDSSAEVRRASAAALGWIGMAYAVSRSDPAALGEAVGPLSAAVGKDSDPQVKTKVAQALSLWEGAGLIRLSPGTKLKVEVALQGGLGFPAGPADQQTGAEERSVAVAEGMARINDFLGRVGSDPAVLLGPGVHDLTESFGKSKEIQAFEREGLHPLVVVPGRSSLAGASLESPPLTLLVEPRFERAVREQLKAALEAGIVRITSDPAAARFVVGSREFVRNERENRLISPDAVFLQVDFLTVRSLTQDFLALIGAVKPGAVLVVGTQAERSDAVVLFQAA